jgi:hypothetical protein
MSFTGEWYFSQAMGLLTGLTASGNMPNLKALSEAEPSSSSEIPSSSSSPPSSSSAPSSSSSDNSTPILASGHFDIVSSQIDYYNLKGEPLGAKKPAAPGVYIEKSKGAARKIVVK